MRFLSYLTTLLIAVLLTACGGGGGAPGTSPGSAPTPAISPPSLFTTAPASLTVSVGAGQEFTIGGGTSPYTAVSNNASIAIAGVKDTRLTLGGVADGVAQITIRDAAGATVTVGMIVSSGPVRPLYTTATSSITVAPGLSGAQTYNVGGGASPYTVTSSNVSVASVVLTGDSMKVTGISVGSTNIVIMDNLGAMVSVTVTVASTAGVLAVTPDTVSVYVNTVVEVAITGGVPPYRVAGGILSVAQTSINGSTLTITPLLVSSGLDISILDSLNQTVKFTLTVIAGQPTIRLSPNALTVSETQSGTISLTVFGATGGVNAFSSDLLLFSTAVSGSTITVTRVPRCVGADTPVTITVVDANRALATSVITVRDNGNILAAVGPPIVVASNCPP